MAFESQYSYAIKENIYECYIPTILSMSETYIRDVGIPTTGFDEEDEVDRSRRSKTYLTTLGILYYYLQGIDVDIVHVEDINDMRRNISGYLTEWSEFLPHAINFNIDEYETIISGLEELNEALYDMLTDDELIEEEEELVNEGNIGMPMFFDIRQEYEKEERKQYSEKYGSISDLLNERNNRY